MASHPKKSNFCGVTLNVLGYRENNEWVALALEMDIRRYGPTFGKTVTELQELVAMQISFAHFKGQPEMIWKAADPIWFERFADVRKSCLTSLMQPVAHRSIHSDYEVTGIPIPPPHVIRQLQTQFAES